MSTDATTRTPAQTLREAARLMRERADGATSGPWAWEATGEKDNSWAVGLVVDEAGRPMTGELEHGQGMVIDGVCEGISGRLPDAAHIASWNPLVALAVADWLDVKAANLDVAAEMSRMKDHDSGYAVALARAYLGETPAPE